MVPQALNNQLKEYFSGVYTKVASGHVAGLHDYEKLQFPVYANRILFQHAFNLGWAGVWSCAICYFALYPSINRLAWLLFLPVHLLDWGYFLAVDTLELAGLFPEAQTYINSTAGILIAVLVYHAHDDCGVGELAATVAVTSLQLLAAVLNKLRFKTGNGPQRPLPVTAEVRPVPPRSSDLTAAL